MATAFERSESLAQRLFSFLFLFAFTFLMVVTLAWTGCYKTIITLGCATTKVHVVAADEMDLTKIACIRGSVAGETHDEEALTKPAGGWPKEITQELCLGKGTWTITLTAYDDAGFLVGVGSGQSVDLSDVNIELRSTVPWS